MRLITLQNDRLTVAVSSLGAELQSIVDDKGVERLWQGDPEIWKGRAPVLFPVAGGFRNDGYELDGKWYPMPKHGFAKLKEWAVETASPTRAVLLLTEREPGFPFAYELRATFALEENRLKVDYTVKNTDSRAFWYSVGAHEAYNLFGALEDYELRFDEAETLARYELNGNLLEAKPNVIGENTRVLQLTEKLLDHDAVVFRNLKSTAVTLQSKAHDRKIRVEYPGNHTIMFWHKPEAPYLCIEPWNNSPDFMDAPLDIAKKPDFIQLSPTREETRSHTIVIF